MKHTIFFVKIQILQITKNKFKISGFSQRPVLGQCKDYFSSTKFQSSTSTKLSEDKKYTIGN